MAGRRVPDLTAGAAGLAHGKAILVGEHFAVHGGGAVAVPVLARSVTVEVVEGAAGIVVADGVRRGSTLSEATLAEALEAMLAELGVASRGWGLRVAGDLPLGAGLGGSAALAAALVRALGARGELDLDRGPGVEALVHRLEHLAHGKPSGIDGAVVSREAPVELVAGRIATLACAPGWVEEAPWWIAIVAREGSTREAVTRVAAFREARRDAYDRMAAESDGAVRRVEELLSVAPTGAALSQIGAIFDDAHARLAALGVSNEALARLVTAARSAGACGAKLSGGGLGGAVIAVAPAGVELASALYSAGAIDVIAPIGARAGGARAGGARAGG